LLRVLITLGAVAATTLGCRGIAPEERPAPPEQPSRTPDSATSGDASRAVSRERAAATFEHDPSSLPQALEAISRLIGAQDWGTAGAQLAAVRTEVHLLMESRLGNSKQVEALRVEMDRHATAIANHEYREAERERQGIERERREATRRAMQGVTLLNYLSLRVGMSYPAVVDVLGQPGDELSSSSIGGITTVMYMWTSSGSGNMN